MRTAPTPRLSGPQPAPLLIPSLPLPNKRSPSVHSHTTPPSACR
ncbi:hypothetical protein [Azospirillum argentinense]|uniref:Uncharacterized protein n=1 Tax=Azospirillum argentinense TaxID=2970906 RepID=A0A5B0KME3_9PROT|nr:hypothetical protein FH063_003034 [Azospirillum argentinense]